MKKIGPFKKIIIANSPYYCGGTVVLSNLARCLRELGYDARVMSLVYFPKKQDNTFLYWKQEAVHLWKMIREKSSIRHYRGCNMEHNPSIGDDAIVVYPETVYGNPLRAKYVVRWFLYQHKFAGDIRAFDKDELFICYREIFNDEAFNPDFKKVHTPYFDSQLYRQYNFDKRVNGACYIVRKGKTRDDLPDSFDGPVIDDMKEEEIVETFNKYKYCYAYDMQSFYSTIAAVCGCISIKVMEPGKKESDYRGKDDAPHYGVAYGCSPDQILYAVETRDLLLQELDYKKSNFEESEKLVHYIREKYENQVAYEYTTGSRMRFFQDVWTFLFRG